MAALSSYRHGKSLAALSALAVGVGALALRAPQTAYVIANPLDLGLAAWAALYAAKCAALAALDHLVGL